MTNKISYRNDNKYEVSYLYKCEFPVELLNPLPQWGTQEDSLLFEYMCVPSSETMEHVK